MESWMFDNLFVLALAGFASFELSKRVVLRLARPIAYAAHAVLALPLIALALTGLGFKKAEVACRDSGRCPHAALKSVGLSSIETRQIS